jgi:hypothetical protein
MTGRRVVRDKQTQHGSDTPAKRGWYNSQNQSLII